MVNDWYQHQKNWDAKSRRASELLLGAEGEVFARAMAATALCLDAVASTVPQDLATKRKISLANHAFNLLWSAWDAVLTGRYDAAASQWRSIDEASDFLMALYADPSFAEQMGGPRMDLRAARRLVRKNLDKLEKGQGKAWLAQRLQTSKSVQPFSHVSLEATGVALAIGTQDGQKIGILRPGGVTSKWTLRLIASNLALAAVGQMMVVAVTFADVSGMESIWEDHVRGVSEKWAEAVSKELRAMNIPQGEIEKIVLVRSDEEPPDPVGEATEAVLEVDNK